MSKFTRIEVALKLKESGIIPVFFHKEVDVCKNVVESCYKGGIRAFEFTNRGDFAHETFSEISKYVKQKFPDMALGVGSVLDGGTAALYIQLGADFIVSPILNSEMAKICNRRKILWAPGCGSLSEISYAEELGAEIVKIFPGKQIGGPDFIKAVKGPMPWTNIMPTGGVDPYKENLKKWFNAGAYCVGMGSKLITNDIIKKENYSALQEIVENVVNTVNSLKN